MLEFSLPARDDRVIVIRVLTRYHSIIATTTWYCNTARRIDVGVYNHTIVGVGFKGMKAIGSAPRKRSRHSTAHNTIIIIIRT